MKVCKTKVVERMVGRTRDVVRGTRWVGGMAVGEHEKLSSRSESYLVASPPAMLGATPMASVGDNFLVAYGGLENRFFLSTPRGGPVSPPVQSALQGCWSWSAIMVARR